MTDILGIELYVEDIIMEPRLAVVDAALGAKTIALVVG